jgi:hypothetical protein
MALSGSCKKNGGEYFSRAEARCPRSVHKSRAGIAHLQQGESGRPVDGLAEGDHFRESGVMKLIVYYVVFMIDLAAYVIGLVIE